MEDKWLLHIEEEARARVHQGLTQIAANLEILDRSEWTCVDDGSRELSIPAASWLINDVDTVKVRLSNGKCRIQACNQQSTDKDVGFSVIGDVNRYLAFTDPTTASVRTVTGWVEGLSEKLSAAREQESTHFREMIAALGLGVAETSGIEWAWVTVFDGNEPDAIFFLSSAGYDTGDPEEMYTLYSPRRVGAQRYMSAELADELERVLKGAVHVAYNQDPQYRALSVSIGAPPDVMVLSDVDEEAKRNAVAALRPGITLFP